MIYSNGNGNSVGSDLIFSVTTDLLTYIKTGDKRFADMQLQFILDTLRVNGNRGKQIRYIARELGELAKRAGRVGSRKVSAEASLYADQLPKSLDDQHLSPQDMQVVQGIEALAIEAALADARAERILELRPDLH